MGKIVFFCYVVLGPFDFVHIVCATYYKLNYKPLVRRVAWPKGRCLTFPHRKTIRKPLKTYLAGREWVQTMLTCLYAYVLPDPSKVVGVRGMRTVTPPIPTPLNINTKIMYASVCV